MSETEYTKLEEHLFRRVHELEDEAAKRDKEMSVLNARSKAVELFLTCGVSLGRNGHIVMDSELSDFAEAFCDYLEAINDDGEIAAAILAEEKIRWPGQPSMFQTKPEETP